VISDQIGFDGGANNSDPTCDAIDHAKDYVLELDTWRRFGKHASLYVSIDYH
jgi:hypothetical protein